jgi:O-antigen/teichoic acid export membrane protein
MPAFVYEIVTAFSARMFAMAGPFVVSIITARILGPEERGRYFLILVVAQIGAQIGTLGLQSSNAYQAANRPELVGPLMANGFLAAWTVAPLVTSLLALALGWPSLPGLRDLVGSPLGSIAFMAALVAPLLVSSLYVTNLAVAIGRVQLFNGLTITYGLFAVLSASIVAAFNGGATAFLLSAAVSLAVPTLAGSVCILTGTSTRFRPDAGLFRRGVAFAAKVYLTTMFGFAMSRIGAFALQHHGSLEEVGQFSVAMQLADGLILLPSTVSLLLFPNLVRAGADDRWPAMWRTFWGLGAIMLVILGALFVLAPLFIPLVFGQSFARAAVLFQALTPSILIVSLISVVSQYLAAEGFPKGQVLAWLIGLLVQLYLSYWFAAKWGGIGVSLSIALAYALVFALLLFEIFSRKRVKTK